jgi:hypothetical protein
MKPTQNAPNKTNEISKQFAKMFDVHWNKYMAGQANMVNEEEEEEYVPENENKEYLVDNPDESGFMLIDEVNANGLPSEEFLIEEFLNKN